MLFGCLIRDVDPSRSDLQPAVDKLASGHSQAMLIELVAIHLPQDRISHLGHDVDQALLRARP